MLAMRPVPLRMVISIERWRLSNDWAITDIGHPIRHCPFPISHLPSGAGLPVEASAELDLPIRTRGRDRTEAGRQRVPLPTATELRLQVLRVEQVERLDQELDPALVRQLDALAHAQIEEIDPRGIDPADRRQAVGGTPDVHRVEVQVAAA